MSNKQVNWQDIENKVVECRKLGKTPRLTKKLVGNGDDPYYKLWATACELTDRYNIVPTDNYIVHDCMVVRFNEPKYPSLDVDYNQTRMDWFGESLFNWDDYSAKTYSLGWIKPTYCYEGLLSDLCAEATEVELWHNHSPYKAECLKFVDNYYNTGYFKALLNISDSPVKIYGYDYIKRAYGLSDNVSANNEEAVIVVETNFCTMVVSSSRHKAAEALNETLAVFHLRQYQTLPTGLQCVLVKVGYDYDTYVVIDKSYEEVAQEHECEKYFASNLSNVLNLLENM